MALVCSAKLRQEDHLEFEATLGYIAIISCFKMPKPMNRSFKICQNRNVQSTVLLLSGNKQNIILKYIIYSSKSGSHDKSDTGYVIGIRLYGENPEPFSFLRQSPM